MISLRSEHLGSRLLTAHGESRGGTVHKRAPTWPELAWRANVDASPWSMRLLDLEKGRHQHSFNMEDQTVGNYLRTHRKRACMSQRDLGLLIGYKHEGQVSRHERSKTVPPLLTALAYEIIFRVPVSAMFPGFHSAVTQMVEGNLIDFEKTLQGRGEKARNIKATAQTLRWIAKRKAP